jgi:hypothetical protein
MNHFERRRSKFFSSVCSFEVLKKTRRRRRRRRRRREFLWCVWWVVCFEGARRKGARYTV